MIEIPVTSAGARTITVEVSQTFLTFRTYYSEGQQAVWLLDIFDIDNNPLATGLALVPGTDNILKGLGEILNGFQLYVSCYEGDPSDPEVLGVSLLLVMYGPGEENLYQSRDPMFTIGDNYGLW